MNGKMTYYTVCLKKCKITPSRVCLTTPTSVHLEPLFLAGPVLDGGVVEGGVEHHNGEGENVGRVLRLKHTPVRLDVLCRKDLWRARMCSVEQVYVRDTCVIDAHRSVNVSVFNAHGGK